MVFPVTDNVIPIIGLATQSGAAFIVQRIGKKQVRPFNLILPYTSVKRFCHIVSQAGYPQAYNADVYTHSGFPGEHAYSFLGWNDSSTAYQNGRADVTNRAVARFQSLAGDPASLGITLVQFGQAMGMMTDRVTRLYNFARDLKKLRFRSAWNHLGATPEIQKRLISKETALKKLAGHYGSMFLEVHFGWVPLVSDCYQAMTVLQNPIPYGKLYASAKLNASSVDLFTPSGWEKKTATHDSQWKCKIGGEIEVTNPNLYIMSQLGLTDPLGVLWDAVPWSFVVGWFGNFQACLSQYTRFAGCTLHNAYATTSLKDFCVTTRSNRYPGYEGTSTVVSSALSIERSTSVPSVTLRVKGLELPPVSRGLTAASLLSQFLSKQRS